MQTTFANSVVLFGVLQPDGTLRLDQPPEIPPGPVQVTIRAVAQPRERIPDLPIEDPSAPPPFDLPRLGTMRAVQPIPVEHRLPDPVQSAEVA